MRLYLTSTLVQFFPNQRVAVDCQTMMAKKMAAQSLDKLLLEEILLEEEEIVFIACNQTNTPSKNMACSPITFSEMH